MKHRRALQMRRLKGVRAGLEKAGAIQRESVEDSGHIFQARDDAVSLRDSNFKRDDSVARRGQFFAQNADGSD